MSDASIRRSAAALLGAALAFGATRAGAQVPTVDPTPDPTSDTPPAAPPSGPSAAQPPPGFTVVQPDGTAVPAADEGFYHYDDYATVEDDDRYTGLGANAPVPETHVVRRGDTLWDLCAFYFNNPWEWPKVWSYNPTITNPHWIYPGDLVRLARAGDEPAPVEPGPVVEDPVPQPPIRRAGLNLRQTAFVEQDKLKDPIVIDGSVQDKALLTTNDAIYLRYPASKPPQVGRRYAIYSETRPLSHPEDEDRVVGSYVRLLGELEVTEVKKDKRARAVITDAVDVIERGHRVGPIKRTYGEVEPTRNSKDLQTTIVAMLGSDQIIGARQLIFLDKGKREGLAVGNRLFVVRRGDAYQFETGPRDLAGQNDERYPTRAIAEVMIIELGEHTSAALVTSSVQEAEIGDHALMRAAR